MGARVEPAVPMSEDAAVRSIAAAPDSEGLRARGVSKTWSGAENPILDSIDLTLAPGRRVSLVGSNGAGKTTLLRIIAGLISPDRGTVTLDGLTATSQRREFHRRIGFLPAGQTGLYARFSVRHHLEYWARIAFVPRRERGGAVEQSVEEFQLGAMLGQRADRLSMGQRQRLRLALAFLHGPRLVLLDEPSTSLDPDGIGVLREAVSRLVATGGTALWCAPTTEEVDVPVDEALRLADGKVRAA
jgi:ABC-type multidrug transport system ATPase subunit